MVRLYMQKLESRGDGIGVINKCLHKRYSVDDYW